MSRRSFWSTWLGGKPRERFSLEELEYLYTILERNSEITSNNRDTIVETLRSIAELMIWGDQHEPKFFEFFLEKNVLGHFHKILQKRENRRGDVAKQVLQTLSIMIQNLRNETSVFYLFSNNHINDIVQLRFDFDDEEVLGYYISFLKTISLKLNAKMVQFFFQDDGATSSFPLYSEAIRFINHKEGMVRAAVRTLTLNVFSVDDPIVQEYVVEKPASNYFTELALYAAEQCQILDRMLSSAETGTMQSAGPLDSQLAEIEDTISYFNDILTTGSDGLGRELCKSLWQNFIGPVLLWPLLDVPDFVSGQQSHQPSLLKPKASVGLLCGDGSGTVRPVCALYVLERLFHLMEQPLLVNSAACCLLAGEFCNTAACEQATIEELKATAPGMTKWGGENGGAKDRVNSQFEASTSGEVVEGHRPQMSPFALQTPANDAFDSDHFGNLDKSGQRKRGMTRTELYVKYRECFIECFNGGNSQLGAAAVRVLVALVVNPAVEPEVLDISGVLPHRRRVRRDLLMQLTGSMDLDDDPQPAGSKPGIGKVGGHGKKNSLAGSEDSIAQRLPQVPEDIPKEFRDKLSDLRLKHLSISSMESLSNGNASPQGSLTSELSARYSASPRTKGLVDDLLDAVIGQVLQDGSTGSFSSQSLPEWGNNQAGVEVVSALCQLLLLPMLPASAIWHVSWLLHQFMPSDSRKGLFGRGNEHQRDVLKAVISSARMGVLDELRGMWCDALLPLLHLEWPKARQGSLEPCLESTSNAVLAWMHSQQSHELGMELVSQEGSVSHQVARRKGLSLSAQAAVHVHHKVKRLVAITQLKEVLSTGTIPEQSGLPLVTEADLVASEVKESCEVQLSEATSSKCTVAFARGQERNVFFSIYGLPASVPSTLEGGGPSTIVQQEEISKSVPVVILAAPSASQLNEGMVLSVAPLLGTDPAIDGTHPRWLHLHVRPSVRRFVKAVQACDQWNRPLIKSWQPLVDGHWVLAFPDRENALSTKYLVQQHTAKIAALYCDILAPLLTPDDLAV